MRIHLIFLFLLVGGISESVLGQRYTISGFIRDAASNEQLIGANVYESSSLNGTISNFYGFYSLSLSPGEVRIIISYLGYENQLHAFKLTKDTVINFNLSLSSTEIEEVTIVGNIQSKLETTQMSMIDIPIEKFAKVPMLLGEADVLKVIQLLPGVQSGTEGFSGIYVRGGGPDQNLFLLDGVPVYNASHLFGFFSVFNPDAVKSVQLYKGGFPARYGERLSSVIDIRMKEGNAKEVHGNFSVGIISSKLSVEGPIVKDKTSFMISARRTYADILARPFIAMANKQDENGSTAGGYYFYDLNTKLNHKFSDKSRLYFSTYLGKDEAYSKDKYSADYYYGTEHTKYESTDKTGLGWGNFISALRWNYLLSNRLFSNTTLTYSKYNFEVFNEYESKDLVNNETEIDEFKYFSGIEDYALKLDFDYYPSPKHSIKFGSSYTYHDFKPGVTLFKYDYGGEGNSIDTTFGDVKIFSNEFVAYAEDDYEITSGLKINAGLRFSMVDVQSKTYAILQPRLSLRYKVNKKLSLKAGYSKMTQFVHLLTTSSISLPTDLWLPVTKNIEPPISHQIAVGGSYQLPKDLMLTIEGFYKTMDNLIEYKEGAGFSGTGTGWESKVEKGKGWAYGGEILIEKTLGKTTGWIGYTLSWTNRQFENLNFGKVFPAKYDRRHDISLVLTHQINKNIDIGTTWVYGTGNAYTLGVMKYPSLNFPGTYNNYYYTPQITEYESKNNYRAPAYHRFDFGVNFNKQKKHGIRTWSYSIYNIYNRKNPFYIFWDTEYDFKNDTSKPVLKQFSLFPIIPSISYSFKF
ncbi:MAG: TonB-dependent receptor [Bacteroidales bacterium]|nr:TonB-dependent receptor [Bacteroidales bacterium]MCF8406065.1 TonB-dependent receptor [Bacteroidales bacterium]